MVIRSTTVAMLLLTLLAGLADSRESGNGSAVTRRDTQLYADLIRQIFREEDRHRACVVVSETVPSAGMSGPYRHPVLKEGEAPAELVNRWTRTQLDKVVIPPFKSSRPLPFVKPAVLDGYFRAGVRGWKEFYRHYPKSVGLIKLSRPVYSADGRQALLFYRWQAAGTAGSSELVLLERTGTGWHPKRTLVLTKI